MRLLRFLKINYRHILLIIVSFSILLLSVIFKQSFLRLLETLRDFGLSVAYYFLELLELDHGITPSVIQKSNYKPFPIFNFPETIEELKLKLGYFRDLFFSGKNFSEYLKMLAKSTKTIAKALLLIMPFVMVFIVVFKRIFMTENNNYDKDSKPLCVWKKLELRVFEPIKNWFKTTWQFLLEHNYYYKFWIFLFCIYFNVISIIMGFLAFYFYFIIEFEFGSIWIQIYKLYVDLSCPIYYIPWYIWLAFGVFLFDRWRKQIGYRILRHNEMKNRGFINSLPIVEMNCGSMGKKKTTLLTDMALSLSVMLKDKAFEKILENDLKFPNFPWINLENELKRAIRFHQVYNLATIKIFCHKKFNRWRKRTCKDKIFNYDYEKYGLTYDDKLKIQNVWEVIEIYSQLYFIYVIESSMILSNYSIRTDILLNDIGNFPLHNTDFFKRDSRLIDSFSRHSHILDFDSLRLGKKLVEDNKLKDSFEFGVVVITEVGKERKNMLELKELKKKEEVTNQKNDGFNDWLKMVRHSATVDNYPFVKVITDEQRPESWGADARDLCQIVNIVNSEEERLAMPFFALGELLYSFVFSKFENLYYEYRFNRGDNTLLMYLLKNVTAKIQNYYKGIYNTFGYCVLNADVESGTQTGIPERKKYYLANKKIYSKRFSTDCFSDFYVQKTLRSLYGICDIPEYETEKASIDELKMQNSYFINDLIKRD